MKRILCLVVLLALGGCANFVLVSPGKVDMNGKIEVETDIAWSGRTVEEGYVWTLDGPGLQSLIFHLGVEDGKTLYKSIDVEPQKVLGMEVDKGDRVSFKFSKAMTEHEIMDLFTASLSKVADSNLQTSGLAPTTLGDKPGFRFDYMMVGKDEVRRRGKVVGAVVGDKLYLVNYIGTDLYHFARAEGSVDKVLASVKFKKP